MSFWAAYPYGVALYLAIVGVTRKTELGMAISGVTAGAFLILGLTGGLK